MSTCVQLSIIIINLLAVISNFRIFLMVLFQLTNSVFVFKSFKYLSKLRYIWNKMSYIIVQPHECFQLFRIAWVFHVYIYIYNCLNFFGIYCYTSANDCMPYEFIFLTFLSHFFQVQCEILLSTCF